MEKPGPAVASEETEEARDISRRIERYRQRLEAEGRTRSLALLDRLMRRPGWIRDDKR